MNDSYFLDTNILVYTYSADEVEKKTLSRDLVSNSNIYISTQVLQELANVLSKKFKKSWQEIQVVLDEVESNCIVYNNSKSTVSQACKIAANYHFSFYDSLIISAALDCNCSVLCSEDLNDNQIIDGKLTIINPFGKR
jgi:predicted nucleic acid-binding protein